MITKIYPACNHSFLRIPFMRFNTGLSYRYLFTNISEGLHAFIFRAKNKSTVDRS